MKHLQLTIKTSIGTFSQSYIPQMLNTYTPLANELLESLQNWFKPNPFLEVKTSGSTGQPKLIQVSKEAMLQSARLSLNTLGLKRGITSLLCISPKYIGGMMHVVRAMINDMTLVIGSLSRNPLSNLDTKIDFTALFPIQIESELQNPSGKQKLEAIDTIIIGGAKLNVNAQELIKNFSNNVYACYGMTETLSHIALKKISQNAEDQGYTPLEGITLNLSQKGTLEILAKHISPTAIQTNDLVEFDKNGRFKLLGRLDNTINSGGLKINLEEVEEIISTYIHQDFALSYYEDETLGQALALLIMGNNITNLENTLKENLPKYKVPKKIIYCQAIPRTENGKIKRKECSELVKRYISL